MLWNLSQTTKLFNQLKPFHYQPQAIVMKEFKIADRIYILSNEQILTQKAQNLQANLTESKDLASQLVFMANLSSFYSQIFKSQIITTINGSNRSTLGSQQVCSKWQLVNMTNHWIGNP